jgi:thiosulfate dehydrogenase
MPGARLRLALAPLVLSTLLATGCEQPQSGLVAEGARLMADEAFAGSSIVEVSCAFCHDVSPTPQRRLILSGGTLFNAYLRPSFWGGSVLDLLDAVNVCVTDFMRGDALAPDEPRAQALLAYLAALSSLERPEYEKLAEAQPFSLVRLIDPQNPPPIGDARRGEVVYQRACLGCHGELHTGEGRLLPILERAILPQSVLETACLLDNANQICTPDQLERYEVQDRLLASITEEKIRHGRYFGISGNMPPYSLETFTDEQIVDILAYFGYQYESEPR